MMYRFATVLLLNLLLFLRATLSFSRIINEKPIDPSEGWNILGRFLRKAIVERSTETPRHRKLQTPPACDQVLDTFNSLELLNYIDQLLVSELGLSGFELIYVQAVILPSMEYGVQIRKICGRCSDYGPGTTACLPDDDGFDALHSGLLIVPLESGSDNQIKRGTSTVNIICHGTQGGNQDVPSNQWSRTNPGPEVFVGVFVTALSGTYSVFPDYIGYASSSDSHYRSYIVRKSYPTAVLPLLHRAEEIIAQETNCASALADSLTVLGYSEGGYAAVAVGDAMYRMGKTIIAVRSGGAPFRLSSAQISFLVRQVTDGTFDQRRRYYIGLIGSTYSQTTTDVLNYGSSQSLLAANQRDNIVNVVHSPAGQSGINAIIPVNDPLSILNQTLIDTFLAALERGETEPCVTSAVVGESDIVCQALQENDLVLVLESVAYPVVICHSVEDGLVTFDNVPDFSNSFLTLEQVQGSHFDAGGTCYFSTIFFFLDDANVRNVPVVDKTFPNGCPVETPQPTMAQPTQLPSENPTQVPPYSTQPNTTSPMPTPYGNSSTSAPTMVQPSSFTPTLLPTQTIADNSTQPNTTSLSPTPYNISNTSVPTTFQPSSLSPTLLPTRITTSPPSMSPTTTSQNDTDTRGGINGIVSSSGSIPYDSVLWLGQVVPFLLVFALAL